MLRQLARGWRRYRLQTVRARHKVGPELVARAPSRAVSVQYRPLLLLEVLEQQIPQVFAAWHQPREGLTHHVV